MKRFYIKQISASGKDVLYSVIDFDKGLNIIHGPSNTGKSYVIGCINFMFGSDDIPFTKAATGYDTVTMRMENEDGDYAVLERQIVDGKNGETIQELTKRRGEMEQAIVEIGDVDVNAKMDSIILEIETVEKEIVEASEKSRCLLEQIYSVSARLEEARFLRDRYKTLHSQYSSDIRRLRFIADADAKNVNTHRLVKCPFCDNDINAQQQKRESYIEASCAELERITLQLQDLQEAERDINREIKDLESQISELNARNDQITRLINKQLKPRAAELKNTVASYKRIVEMRQEVYALEAMSTELNTDVFNREMEEDGDALTFEPRKLLNNDAWKKLSEQFGEMVIECNYSGHPVARISIDTLDAVVNGKFKKDEGKGYRAFLNTLMLFNLMKFLEVEGTYAPRMLFLDSPILSLKEKKHKIKENEKATPSMRESLFQYIVNNCGDNQIIIAENELPDGVDYSTAGLIEFTMDEEVGRYGFLLSERNVGNE